ncbi:hypothetical protein C1N80_04845 [Brachybacterium sp. SGAir0954]|uniref:hypothetical protein n=1 Tax=Brachybacterium sp. SGAir0954 TaxID=2571029 RepID=UPI0010CD4C1C|nr:hypothetical protein [Brachybacterium sp. SGAir0954]QCR52974.1 hypothetical protein C1N80_04845 [Brachybacterium sp. SGAir0954]
MSPRSERTRTVRWKWVWVGAFAVVALIVGSLVLIRPDSPEPPTPSPTVPSPSEEPVVVEDSVSLTVPNTIDLPAKAVPVESGKKYLFTIDIKTEKPSGSPGDAMYFGFSLNCTGPEPKTARGVGGTQNLVSGEPVELSNQFLLAAEETGDRRCKVALSSPNESAAAAGTTVDAEVTWTAKPVDEAVSVPSEDRLPVVIQPGERRATFRYVMPLPADSREVLRVMSTLRVTTCTIVNGSREGGQTLCPESQTDERGSSFDIDLRADLLDEDGNLCDSLDLIRDATHVDQTTHHAVRSLNKVQTLPEEPCGDRVQFVLAVDNQGPAPLLVHGTSSTFIAVLADE